MGRVFSPLEIQYCKIPSLENDDLERAVEVARIGIADCVDRGDFTGGIIFGSAAVGIMNRRSDIDMMVSLPDATKYNNGAVRELSDKIKKTSPYIPFDLPVYTVDDLSNGRHEIDRFFGEHLSSGDREVIGEDPMSIIKYPDVDGIDILNNYLHQKRRRMIDALPLTHIEMVDKGVAQRLLELPIAIGRKCVQVLSESFDNESFPKIEHNVNKCEVIKKSRQTIGKIGVNMVVFEKLLEMNNDCTTIGEKAIETHDIHDLREYVEFLRELKTQLPDAIRWLTDVEIKTNEIL